MKVEELIDMEYLNFEHTQKTILKMLKIIIDMAETGDLIMITMEIE